MGNGSSPALVIQLTGVSSAERDRLVAFLSDFDLLAVQEDDTASPSAWIAHFSSASRRGEAARALSAAPEFAALPVRPIEVEDGDWARRTQADLPAIRIGRIIVAPPWDVPQVETSSGGVVLVVIEPSRGFGTGHHQSTRLCLTLLQNRNLEGQTMIDVGTGSGVLAIAAAKLGAAYVAAIDVDPDAIENARENIAANDAGAIVDAHVEDFTATARQPADVVTANLTATILARHARDLGRYLRPAGAMIVAGFNIEEKNLVEQAFQPEFAVIETAEEEGWCAFVLTRLPS